MFPDIPGPTEISRIIETIIAVVAIAVLLIAAVSTVKAKWLPIRLASVAFAVTAVIIAEPLTRVPEWVVLIPVVLALLVAGTVARSVHKTTWPKLRGDLIAILRPRPTTTWAEAAALVRTVLPPRSLTAFRSVAKAFVGASGLRYGHVAAALLLAAPAVLQLALGALSPLSYVVSTVAVVAVAGGLLLEHRDQVAPVETAEVNYANSL